MLSLCWLSPTVRTRLELVTSCVTGRRPKPTRPTNQIDSGLQSAISDYSNRFWGGNAKTPLCQFHLSIVNVIRIWVSLILLRWNQQWQL